MPAISIIVPVYNALPYLQRCLDSIAAQTFEDYEAILVNDGSTDDSGSVCELYAAKDSRFRVIHQENQGVSGARQRGLDATRGKYIIHADPDDWVEPMWLETLHTEAERSAADLVICDAWKDDGTASHYISQKADFYEAAHILRESLIGRLFCWQWNKLVRKNPVITSGGGISYTSPPLCCYEDVLFICRLLPKAHKISHVPSALYHYCYNAVPNSLSKQNTLAKYTAKKRVLQELETLFDSESYDSLFNWKSSILNDSLHFEKWEDIPALYPEVNGRFIRQCRFSLRNPDTLALKLILQQHTLAAKLIYHAHSSALSLLRSLKHLIHP